MDYTAYRAKFLEYENAKEKNKENIKKIWVCGPPIMQEEFDRAQDSIQYKKIEYHVLWILESGIDLANNYCDF